MEFLSLLYTVLLVAICLQQALLLYRSGKPAPRQDDEALKEWVRQQLDAQSKLFVQKQAELARQNYDAMRGISETLQTAVQGMSSTLNAGQAAQQQTMEQRLQGLEASNARKLEEMRKTLAESMAALQAQNAQKLDEIRCTVDEQLQDALQKRVTESFKASSLHRASRRPSSSFFTAMFSATHSMTRSASAAASNSSTSTRLIKSSAASCAILPLATRLFREAASLSLWRCALAVLEAYSRTVWPLPANT